MIQIIKVLNLLKIISKICFFFQFYSLVSKGVEIVFCAEVTLYEKSENTQTHCGPMAELRILRRNQIICQVYDLFNFFN